MFKVPWTARTTDPSVFDEINNNGQAETHTLDKSRNKSRIGKIEGSVEEKDNG